MKDTTKKTPQSDSGAHATLSCRVIVNRSLKSLHFRAIEAHVVLHVAIRRMTTASWTAKATSSDPLVAQRPHDVRGQRAGVFGIAAAAFRSSQ